MIIRLCKSCEEPFKTTKTNWYCEECDKQIKEKRRVDGLEHRRKKKNFVLVEEIRKCESCGKDFLWSNSKSNQIYCSEKCGIEKRIKEGKNETPFLKIRFEILKRDNFTCQYCGRSVKDGIKLEVDHINPKSKSGEDNKENLITSCSECNLGKGDIILSEYLIAKLKRGFNGN